MEDLMKEHGLLNRILLIYDELVRRNDNDEYYDPDIPRTVARIVRLFIEDHHEEMEEKYVFPKLRSMNLYIDLIDILTEQHNIGRYLTDRIIDTGDIQAMRDFTHMYRAHESREDTQIFPTFHSVCSEEEYDIISKKMEDEEHLLLGYHGYRRILQKVMSIEILLDIHDLDTYTV